MPDQYSGLGIPNSERVIIASRSDGFAIGAVGQVYSLNIYGSDQFWYCGLSIPKAGFEPASCSDSFAIGAIGYRKASPEMRIFIYGTILLVCIDGIDKLPCLRIPNFDDSNISGIARVSGIPCHSDGFAIGTPSYRHNRRERNMRFFK